MSELPRVIQEVEDVDERVLHDAEDVAEWWTDGEPIDWERFVDKLADYGALADPPYDLEDYNTPAVRKIQRHIRGLRRD